MKLISPAPTIMKVEKEIEKETLHKRFTLEKLKERYGAELCWNDLSAVNLADYNIMFEYEWFDVDLYCLIDRHWLFYITEIWVNPQ